MILQASPSDPKTFPFILLGNKIDVDGGNSRVVRIDFELWHSSSSYTFGVLTLFTYVGF